MVIEAFIFDLDGVITDTALYHFKAWKELATSIGIDIDENFNEKLKGISRSESLELILKHGKMGNMFSNQEKLALTNIKNDHYKSIIKTITPNDYLPGISLFLNEIRKAGYKIGLASASLNAPSIVNNLKANNYIEYIVNPLQVKYGKPAPDLFLDVAMNLQVNPKNCIGLEDSLAGIHAINAAGMFSIAIGSSPKLKDADLLYPSTIDLNLENILKNAP